ncbi:major histocompatibility complex class I-related gene protein-like, partial [Gambusia affinis]|uniref:major histocompatibility complex class I-related gene protein-like n=1 Tax=Gambusia affinis TaxID=33528 RepID=UPI001CDBC9DE
TLLSCYVKIFCLCFSSVHIYQSVYETEQINGYKQYGYDGEHFLVFHLNTCSWKTAKHQGFITKHKWDHDPSALDKLSYCTQICSWWLKKYMNYGPCQCLSSIRLHPLQSAASCTGFYPNRAEKFWRKEREEIYEGVDKGEILPNNDRSFQMSVDIDLPPEGWTKYECVFQVSGESENLIKLENNKKSRPILVKVDSEKICFHKSIHVVHVFNDVVTLLVILHFQ